MNGPNEFHVIGSLRDWGVEDCLPDIAVPTLILSGRHDEATPKHRPALPGPVPDARWEIFEESSHLPHLEEPELPRGADRLSQEPLTASVRRISGPMGFLVRHTGNRRAPWRLTTRTGTALVFPGMGPSPFAEVGKFMLANPLARELFAEADEVLGYSLVDRFRRGRGRLL